MKTFSCTVCGTPVLVKPNKERRNSNHFCSRACYDEHNRTGSFRNGYKVITVNGSQIMEHRFIMKARLGRPLSADEHVHHIDENRLNNAITNLMLVSKEEHLVIHKTRHDLADDHFVNLWEQGESTRGIAGKLGCSQTEVRRRLLDAKVDTASRQATCLWDVNEAVRLRNTGHSFAKIGAMLGVSGPNVRQAFLRRGLSTQGKPATAS